MLCCEGHSSCHCFADINMRCEKYSSSANTQCHSVLLITNNLVKVDKSTVKFPEILQKYFLPNVSTVCRKHLKHLLCLQSFLPCSRPSPSSCGDSHRLCATYCHTFNRTCHQWLKPGRKTRDFLDCVSKRSLSDPKAGTHPECISLSMDDTMQEGER